MTAVASHCHTGMKLVIKSANIILLYCSRVVGFALISSGYDNNIPVRLSDGVRKQVGSHTKQ